MARQKNNLVMKGVSGKIGGMLILKQYAYGTVVSKIPDRTKVIASVKQEASSGVFRKAVKYAQEVLKDPAKSAAYRSVMPEGKTVYHTAIADYMAEHSPGS